MSPPEQQAQPLLCSRCGSRPIVLSTDTLPYPVAGFIRMSNHTGFCQACVIAVNEMLELTESNPLPAKADDLVEGVHYYMEKGLRVMTEFYLLSRGYCCESGCRHCPYGYAM